MEPARHLVATAVAEFSSGMQHRQHHLGGRTLLLLHDVDGNTTAIVADCAAVVGVYRNCHRVAVAGQCFVDRVVHDLVDEVMESAGTGRTDVHAGSLAHRLQALKNRDVLCAIGRVAAARVISQLLPFETLVDGPEQLRTPLAGGAVENHYCSTAMLPVSVGSKPAPQPENPCKFAFFAKTSTKRCKAGQETVRKRISRGASPAHRLTRTSLRRGSIKASSWLQTALWHSTIRVPLFFVDNPGHR